MGDTEKYIEKLKNPHSDVEEVIQQVRNDKARELLDKRAELEITKLEAEIRKLQEEGKPTPPATASTYVGQMLAAHLSDPKKAKEFLKGLTQEEINNLAALMALDNGRAGALLQIAGGGRSNVKDLIEIAKLMQPQQNVDIKGLAEIFKAGVEAARSNQPQPNTVQEGWKYLHDTFVKPFQETMNKQNQDLMEAKLKALEAKMPPSPMQWLEGTKAAAQAIGLTEKNKSSELDLKLEEMRQSHDLDLERLRWEQRKYLLQQDAERDKWGAIQQTFSPIFAMAGPEIREGLKNIGRQVGGALQQKEPSHSQGKVNMVPFTCPECNTQLSVPVPPDAPDVVPVKCPNCGKITKTTLKTKQETPPEEAPPEEKPRTRLKPTYR